MCTVDLYAALIGEDSGGTWSQILNAGNSVINIPNNGIISTTGVNPGVYTFRYTVWAGGCSSSTDVTVTVLGVPGVLTLNSPCNLTWTNLCPGYPLGWIQKFNTQTNSWGAPITAVQPYVTPSSGDYRVWYSNPGCNVKYSNTVTVPVFECTSEYSFTDSSTGNKIYSPSKFHFNTTGASYNPPGIPNTFRYNINYLQSSTSGWTVQWGDGTTSSGSGNGSLTHTYPSINFYKPIWTSNLNAGTVYTKNFIYVNGSAYHAQYAEIEPGSTSSPVSGKYIFYKYKNCQFVHPFFFFTFSAVYDGNGVGQFLDPSLYQYDSHQLYVNGNPIPINRTVITPEVWQFNHNNFSHAYIDLAVSSTIWHTVELKIFLWSEAGLNEVSIGGIFKICG